MSIQVSQVSVETLFRRGGKCLHHFEANLFRKQCTKLHQNRPSYVGDIIKKIFGLFFWTYTGMWYHRYRPKHAPHILTTYQQGLFYSKYWGNPPQKWRR